jgi:hypothetical protein
LPDDVFKTHPNANEEQVLFNVIGTFIAGQQVDALSSYTPAKKNAAKVVVLVVVDVVVGAAVVVLVVVVVVVGFAASHSMQPA